jgi:hypothetical protein
MLFDLFVYSDYYGVRKHVYTYTAYNIMYTCEGALRGQERKQEEKIDWLTSGLDSKEDKA